MLVRSRLQRADVDEPSGGRVGEVAGTADSVGQRPHSRDSLCEVAPDVRGPAAALDHELAAARPLDDEPAVRECGLKDQTAVVAAGVPGPGGLGSQRGVGVE
jgi:hypothetical protein